MRILITLAFVIFTAQLTWAQNIRLINYNAHNAIGMDGKTDYKRTANLIAQYKPNVVAMQELDNKTQRSGGISVLDQITSNEYKYRIFAQAIEFQGGGYGIGIASKLEPITHRQIALPGKEEARVALIVEFKDFVLCNTHLSLTAEDRAKSIEIIKKELAKESKPVILCGDLNDTPDSAVIQSLSSDFSSLVDTSTPTYPADKPHTCIDYIFISNANHGYKHTIKRAEVINDSITSDHRPMIVDIKLRKTK